MKAAPVVARALSLVVVALTVLPGLAGCGHKLYAETRIGEFRGSVNVRWVKPDKFLYIPDAKDPLKFISPERTIEAQAMYTDGGSIPRFLWGIPDTSERAARGK